MTEFPEGSKKKTCDGEFLAPTADATLQSDMGWTLADIESERERKVGAVQVDVVAR